MRWLAACKLRWQTGCEGEILEMAMMYEDDIWCQCYCDAWWGFVLVDVCMLLDPYAATWPCHILPPQDTYLHIDGLVQERRNSIANALELRLYCTNPSLWSQDLGDGHDVWRWYQVSMLLWCMMMIFHGGCVLLDPHAATWPATYCRATIPTHLQL